MYYIFDIQYKEGLLNNLLFSMTHVGQEARILTKYYVPDHKKLILIQENIFEFRKYITEKKLEKEKEKEIVQTLLKNEEELDKSFIDEITKELDKEIQGNNVKQSSNKSHKKH